MKGGFLRSVAELHSEKFGSSVSDFCFIFPNRRSSLFFANYLGKSSNRAIFSPKLITIDELFNSLSGLKMVSKVEFLPKVKFSEPAQEETTKGDSIEFKTPVIEGTVTKLADGTWSRTKTFTTKEEAITFLNSLMEKTS